MILKPDNILTIYIIDGIGYLYGSNNLVTDSLPFHKIGTFYKRFFF